MRQRQEGIRKVRGEPADGQCKRNGGRFGLATTGQAQDQAMLWIESCDGGAGVMH